MCASWSPDSPQKQSVSGDHHESAAAPFPLPVPQAWLATGINTLFFPRSNWRFAGELWVWTRCIRPPFFRTAVRACFFPYPASEDEPKLTLSSSGENKVLKMCVSSQHFLFVLRPFRFSLLSFFVPPFFFFLKSGYAQRRVFRSL